MKIKLLLLLPFFLMMHTKSEEAVFWGKNGHRVTGKIAEKHLTRKAKKQIDKLLKGQSLAFVSTFADEIKSDRKYSKYYPWHYVNMNLDQTYQEAEKNPKGDLVTGINACIEILKDKTSSEEDKAFHLKLLIHFVGDLHQPMHIGQKEDKGGNAVQVEWFGKGTNLHAVWDSKMIDDWEMSYVELANNAADLSKEEIKAIEQGTIIDWVHEVHKITKEVYNSVEKGENLRYQYSYDHFGTVRMQLQKGGIRLAKVLNEIYD
ncbi:MULTISPECIES: S1/P1 nuclease [unclassified Polaribacter]|uniref:S1/P1 nuclease n=1 Tax=unclassified Polaribacter TaxID=196858 RepID=UPI0011BFCF30|nr:MULTISPECIES: S1/P1 nuclease [unclassified Polaribacter]TXD51952.1 S1/P1 nuclease [Polaribacter sp. IC063]TXD59704.1 S1/P1 nuclease [Polaribacter sp. IC066]